MNGDSQQPREILKALTEKPVERPVGKRNLRDLAEREEFISIDVIARALQISRKTLMRSWRRDGVTFVQEGRHVLLHREIVVRRYLPQEAVPVSPVAGGASGHT